MPLHLPAFEEARKQAWLLKRRDYIASSDVAAILGLSKWTSPLQVWLDKKGLAEPSPGNEFMEWGNRLQGPILDAYAERFEARLLHADPWTLEVDTEQPRLASSFDSFIIAEDGQTRLMPVDAKNIGWRNPEEWGEDESDMIPIQYATQLMVQMMVTRTQAADLAVLFGGNKLVRFRAHFDPESAALIRERVGLWWERHIIQDVQPPVDGNDRTTEWLKGRFKKNTEPDMIPATAELQEAARRYQEAHERATAAEQEKKAAGNVLRAAIGNHSGIAGICTWTNNKDKAAGFDYEGAWKELTATQPASVWQGLVAKYYLPPTPGDRVLRMKK